MSKSVQDERRGKIGGISGRVTGTVSKRLLEGPAAGHPLTTQGNQLTM
jgi:hypothetical protein